MKYDTFPDFCILFLYLVMLLVAQAMQCQMVG
jgi:hypothetical protein